MCILSICAYYLSRRTIFGVQQRDDLAALLMRAGRRVQEGEKPILAARGLTMWGYVALSQLARKGAAPTQYTLASAIGYDKTRLIGLLDELESDGLVAREPDPSDRRARIVHITERGREVHQAVVADIRAMEETVLADLSE